MSMASSIEYDRQRGAVLLLMALLLSTASFLAMAAMDLGSDQLRIARYQQDALRAELASQSGAARLIDALEGQALPNEGALDALWELLHQTQHEPLADGQWSIVAVTLASDQWHITLKGEAPNALVSRQITLIFGWPQMEQMGSDPTQVGSDPNLQWSAYLAH